MAHSIPYATTWSPHSFERRGCVIGETIRTSVTCSLRARAAMSKRVMTEGAESKMEPYAALHVWDRLHDRHCPVMSHVERRAEPWCVLKAAQKSVKGGDGASFAQTGLVEREGTDIMASKERLEQCVDVVCGQTIENVSSRGFAALAGMVCGARCCRGRNLFSWVERFAGGGCEARAGGVGDDVGPDGSGDGSGGLGSGGPDGGGGGLGSCGRGGGGVHDVGALRARGGVIFYINVLLSLSALGRTSVRFVPVPSLGRVRSRPLGRGDRGRGQTLECPRPVLSHGVAPPPGRGPDA